MLFGRDDGDELAAVHSHYPAGQALCHCSIQPGADRGMAASGDAAAIKEKKRFGFTFIQAEKRSLG